ncbi:MAG: cation:proton antiporter [archaeon]
MVEELFINLSVILIFGVLVSALMKMLKQPLIIGYIVTGLLVGPSFLNLLASHEAISTFAQIGVAFLLFMVGLHLNPKVIKEVGFVSLVTGIGQVLFTSLIGFFISKALGFSFLTSVYISVALTFSSTIIIMKLLSDKRDLDSLYGRIAVGFLIVQDLIAIFALMAISSLAGGSSVSSLLGFTLLKGILLIGSVFLFSVFVLKRLFRFIANSQEFLFLFSIGWCMAISSLFYFFNFSIEIGALLAGVTLSMCPYSTEISSKTKPIRDFFIVLFFILLGSQMVIGDIHSYIFPIIFFSLFILLGNPLIVMILMGVLGYTKRTSFLAGLTVAQISEFSLILIALGIRVGHLSNEILSIVTTVGLITIAGSTYMILYSEKLYNVLSPYLNIFERSKVKEKNKIKKDYKAILFGYNRIGFGILRALKEINKKYLVVDFNPETIKNLSKIGLPCVYGDAYDSEFLDELALDKIDIAISTIPEFETNVLLLEQIRMANSKTIIILRAHNLQEALDLYKKGASYVLTPHFLGGEYIAKMIIEDRTQEKEYKSEREKHIKMLNEMIKRGHEHPEVN